MFARPCAPSQTVLRQAPGLAAWVLKVIIEVFHVEVIISSAIPLSSMVSYAQSPKAFLSPNCYYGGQKYLWGASNAVNGGGGSIVVFETSLSN